MSTVRDAIFAAADRIPDAVANLVVEFCEFAYVACVTEEQYITVLGVYARAVQATAACARDRTSLCRIAPARYSVLCLLDGQELDERWAVTGDAARWPRSTALSGRRRAYIDERRPYAYGRGGLRTLAFSLDDARMNVLRAAQSAWSGKTQPLPGCTDPIPLEFTVDAQDDDAKVDDA